MWLCFCANQNQAIKYFPYLLFLLSCSLSLSCVCLACSGARALALFLRCLWDMLAAGRGLRLAHVLMLPMILLVVGLLKLSLDVFVSDFLFIYLIIRVFNVAVWFPLTHSYDSTRQLLGGWFFCILFGNLKRNSGNFLIFIQKGSHLKNVETLLNWS